jgi:hypothetical protein
MIARNKSTSDEISAHNNLERIQNFINNAKVLAIGISYQFDDF